MKVDCRAKATHAVKMVVPDRNSDRTAAEGFLGVELCKEHLAECKTKPFFDANPAIEKLLRNLAAPGTEPDVLEAYVEGVPLGSPEHLAHKAAANGKADA